jgi:hypothetical protein
MGNDDVLIAVDPHKGHHTLVELDPASRRPVEEGEFANTHAGYREMMRFARRWRQRHWAVEGCPGAGRFLARYRKSKPHDRYRLTGHRTRDRTLCRRDLHCR